MTELTRREAIDTLNFNMTTLLYLRQVIRKHGQRNVKDFLRNTALHGLRYICETNLPLWAKSYFGIIFVIAVVAGINLAVNVFYKWESTPVIIGINSKMTSIETIPFPAITVCNMNQAKYSKVAHFPEESLDYVMLQKTCFVGMNYTPYSNTEPRYNGDTFPNFIIKISEKCEDMIISCKFHQEDFPCTDIFREIFVDEGLCCVFNLMHPYHLYKFSAPYVRDYTSKRDYADVAVDWNPITGYPEHLPVGFYPRPGKGSGVEMGLQIVLNGHIDDYYCSSTNGQGFKVLLYNPIDQPRIKESGLPVILGRQTNFRIIARSFEALAEIRNVGRTTRQCIFSDEQELLYYRYYTRRNCENECDALYFLRLCHCIPYYLPLVYSNATVCDVPHFDCLNNAEMQIFDKQSTKCKELCLTSCHDLSFFPHAFSTPFTKRDIKMQNDFLTNFSTKFIRNNLAVVNFYYNDDFFRSNVKSSYTGLTEYMSLTGGIMSLMFGFSVILISELFYYIFTRSLFEYMHYWRMNRRKRASIL